MQVYDPEFVKLMIGETDDRVESIKEYAESYNQKVKKEKWLKMPISKLPSKRRYR